MKGLFCVLALFSFYQCQTEAPTATPVARYQIVLTWPAGTVNCAGTHSGFAATNFGGGSFCTPLGCSCQSNIGCTQIFCNQTTLPNNPPNPIVSAQYASGTSCSGVVTFYTAVTSGTCGVSSVSSNTSVKFICDGQFYQQTWNNNGQCSGTPSSQTTPVSFSGSYCNQGFYISCPALCFHKDTNINYNGQEISYKSLKASKDPVCSIPHVVTANGVKITTTCPGELRVTHEHLVMTIEGWKEAGSLSRGQFLYSKVGDDSPLCEITQIEIERDQEYFGLNCEDSDVEANGYWVSTFGKVHRLPSVWMKIASKIVGVQRASSIGDRVASYLIDWGLL
jgi:hypothetical protein